MTQSHVSHGRAWLWPSAVVAVAFSGVFALPWIVPVHIARVLSQSQAVGFSNRVAMLALAAAAVALFFLARLGQNAPDAANGPLVTAQGAPAVDRVSPWLIGSAMALTLLMVALIGGVLGDSPFGDAQYFTDRMLRVIAGGVPFSQIEFSYGPLMLYLPLASWRLLRWTGASIYTVYYCWVGLFHLAGLAAAAYLLNRIVLRKALRNAAFLVVAGFGFLQPTLGLNYTPLRFLLPYVLFIWVMERQIVSPRGLLQRAAPVLAVVIVASVTPEMGIALLVGLSMALLLLTFRDRNAYLPTLMVLLFGAAAAVVAAVVAGAGTLGAFAGGAYYFPVLPGPPALIFVVTMLLLAWQVGSAGDRAGTVEDAVQVGWLAIAVVLIAPALGRADFVHVFFNGLGAILVCAAVIDRRWHKAGVYLAVVGGVFLTSMVVYIGISFSPALTDAGLKAITSSPRHTVLTAKIFGSPSMAAESQRREFEAARAVEVQAAARLAAIPALGFPGPMRGKIGLRLASTGHLMPTYFQPGSTLNEADFRKAAAQLDAVDTLALQTRQLVRYRDTLAESTTNADGLVMTVPPAVGGPVTYGVLLGFPATFRGRHEIFNPAASFGALLQRDWVAYGQFGGYTLLRKR